MVGYITDPTRKFIEDRTAYELDQEFLPTEAGTKGFDPASLRVGSGYGSINDAISRRSAEALYDPNMVKGLRELNYLRDKGKGLARVARLQAQQQQLDAAAAGAMQQRAAQEEAQRNAIITSVLSVAGTIVGGAFGGPLGAAGGGAAGNAAGTAITGGGSAQQGYTHQGYGYGSKSNYLGFGG